jgi:predicted  nucleic acid-binding Zn-ribbon protein
MFTASLTAFAALSIALLLLVFLTLFLATRHDKVVTLAGPLEEEGAVLARIAEKRATLTDLELELEQRRKALALTADIQAEVDALIRKRDALLIEWNQMADRRNEIEALRLETEAAQIAKVEVEAGLAAARADLEALRDRLARADEISRRIETLTAERDALEASVAALKKEAIDLQAETQTLREAQAEMGRLREALAEVQGRLAARQSELAETDSRLEATKAALVAAKSESDGLGAWLAASKMKLADLTEETDQQAARLATLQAQEADLRAAIAGMEDLRGDLARSKTEQAQAEALLAALRQKLEEASVEAKKLQEANEALTARKSVLEREVEKLRALASGQSPTEEDPLKDLKDPPQVVRQLSQWPVQSNPSEAEALHRVRKRFEAFGLAYPDRTLRAFHTAMKVNETTQMAVLAGISGTGKSQMPRQYAAGMGIGFLQVPVQPRWDSPQDLMGFYNYIEGRFRPTDMARALHALDNQNNPDALPDRLLMVLLDEMNLARVEYYFSDFLSRLESRPARGREGDRNLRKDAEIELEIPKAALRIFPGYNLLFAGTMNEDESTQSLSDKVVDRANVLRFGAPKTVAHAGKTTNVGATEALDRKHWETWCARGLNDQDKARASDKVNEMLALMQDFGKPFGHRLGRAILAYAGAYPEGEGIGNRVDMALADQIEMRLLPKLRGVDVEEKNGAFESLRKMAESLGDDALAQAIRSSVEAAEATGQFVWKGVIR